MQLTKIDKTTFKIDAFHIVVYLSFLNYFQFNLER